jgi:hypothetical protein
VATPESKASQVVRLRATARGSRVFRNNSGVLFNQEGVPIRFGLGNESKKINQEMKTSDFIGWTQITITPEMIGKKVAVFTAIEAKALGFKVKKIYPKKSREHAQNKFITIVNNAGGIAGFASCDADTDVIYNEFNRKVTE